MFTMTTIRRSLRLTSAAMLLAAVTACDDDPTEVEPEPTFATMRLAVAPAGAAGTSVDVTRANASVSGPLTIPNGASTLTAAFLTAGGQADPLVTAADFELRIAPTTSGAVTFTRTGPFTFSVNRTGAVGAPVQVQLFHLGENHEELEANVTLQ